MTKGIGDEIYALIEKLYPINRSITGNGLRESLRLVQKELPIELHEIPTGTQSSRLEHSKRMEYQESLDKEFKRRENYRFCRMQPPCC